MGIKERVSRIKEETAKQGIKKYKLAEMVGYSKQTIYILFMDSRTDEEPKGSERLILALEKHLGIIN
jgi:DNA-binding XRE family transcriptional regulator